MRDSERQMEPSRGFSSKECPPMLNQAVRSRNFGMALAVLLVSAWSVTEARAFFPQSQPPFPPQTGVEPLPPIIIPDPVPPTPTPTPTPVPPVRTPEPGTMMLGLIGGGIVALVRRRKAKLAQLSE